jgi:hypothetical protein
MRETAGSQPVSLVVLDAAADFYGPGADENRAADMEPSIRAVKRIARELSCFVLLVAHSGYEGDHVRGTSRFGQVWDFEAQSARDAALPGCGWLRITKAKDDADGYSIPFRVAMTGAGSLAVHYGHDGAAAEAVPDEPPLSGTQARVRGDVLDYVREHGGETGVTFRRIDLGVMGKQQHKRQMLDLLCRDFLVAESDGPKNSKLYMPGGMAGWIEKFCPENW